METRSHGAVLQIESEKHTHEIEGDADEPDLDLNLDLDGGQGPDGSAGGPAVPSGPLGSAT